MRFKNFRLTSMFILSILFIGCGGGSSSSNDTASSNNDITDNEKTSVSTKQYLAKNIVFRDKVQIVQKSVKKEDSFLSSIHIIASANADDEIVDSETKIYADNVIYSRNSNISSLTSTNVQDAIEESTIDLGKYLPGTKWNIKNYGASVQANDAFSQVGVVEFNKDGGLTLLSGSFAAAGISIPRGECRKIKNECRTEYNHETGNQTEVCKNVGEYCGPGEDITLSMFGSSTFLAHFEIYDPETGEVTTNQTNNNIFWPTSISKTKIIFIGNGGPGAQGMFKISELTLVEE